MLFIIKILQQHLKTMVIICFLTMSLSNAWSKNDIMDNGITFNLKMNSDLCNADTIGMKFKRDTIATKWRNGLKFVISIDLPTESIISKRETNDLQLIFYQFPRGCAYFNIRGLLALPLLSLDGVEYNRKPVITDTYNSKEFQLSSGKFVFQEEIMSFYEIDNVFGINFVLICKDGYEDIINRIIDSLLISVSISN